MADAAQAYDVNYGRAEEIYLMRPDLVIAGQFASSATVSMLRRLGIRVEVRDPAESIAALRRAPGRDRAALYYANGFTSGRGTLAGEILDAAGYRNIASDYGIENTAPLPLELLVMSQPDR